MYPHGDDSKKKTLYVCDIANVKAVKRGKSGDAIRSNYIAKFYPKNHITNKYRAVEVKYFPRYVSYGAWRLLYECLKRFFETKPDKMHESINMNLFPDDDTPRFEKIQKKKTFKYKQPRFHKGMRVIKTRG